MTDGTVRYYLLARKISLKEKDMVVNKEIFTPIGKVSKIVPDYETL